jgi:hypothetical protein
MLCGHDCFHWLQFADKKNLGIYSTGNMHNDKLCVWYADGSFNLM